MKYKTVNAALRAYRNLKGVRYGSCKYRKLRKQADYLYEQARKQFSHIL
jgi:hypothetical protein